MKYVTYDPTTGEIKTSGQCDIPSPAPDHGTLLENADGSNATDYVLNGVLTAYTTAQAAVKAAVPDYPATWSNTTFSWVDSRDVATALSDTIDALTTAYTTAIALPVSYTNTAGIAQTYQADPDSRNDVVVTLLGCQATQATPAGFFWVALDNTHVPFSYADLQGLAAALLGQGAPAFAKLQALKVQARAATTLSQLESITW